jgi:hypothetical protein
VEGISTRKVRVRSQGANVARRFSGAWSCDGASNLDAELQAHGGAVRSELRLTPTWFVEARYEKVRVDGRATSQVS